MNRISLIIPCYNEEEVLPLLFEELLKLSDSMPNEAFDFIFINDGSDDATLAVIKEMKQRDERVHFISFSRNFGKESAIYAGLRKSKGDYVAILDADLQDPPLLIKDMYEILKTKGRDCVAARRVNRKGDPVIRSFFAKCFYKVIKRISDTEMVNGVRDFRLMTRQVVDAVLEMNEYNRFSKGIFGWIGFDTEWILYDNVERQKGRTKWSFLGLLIYSMEGITGFSTKPLYIASGFGLLFCIIAFIMICVIIFKTLVFGDDVQGYPSTLCVIFFIGGIQLFCLGILGQYLSKTYLETKKRPIFIVKEESK